MSDLHGLVGRLADALGRLDDTTHLVISRLGSESFVGYEGSNRFVQFARTSGLLRAESVGDTFIDKADRLSDGQRAALARLGWQDPDESGSYWRHWDAPFPLEDAAALAVETLQQVHGATDFEQLNFDAAPHLLAALSGTNAMPDPRVLRPGYWDYDSEQSLTCPSCAWTGSAGEHQEQHRDVIDVRCPNCDQLLLVAAFPTLDETRAAAAAGNARAVAGLPDIEEQSRATDRAYSSLLSDPAQLPELSGEDLVIDWDLEGDGDETRQVLRYGGVVMWRETVFYESYRRFEEVFAILRARYGSRFAGLVPTAQSEPWLYGDRLGSVAIVESLNRSLSNAASARRGVLKAVADELGAKEPDVAAALPGPIEPIDIDDSDATRWLRCGDPVLVLVGSRPDAVVIAEPSVEWLGHTPAVQVRGEHTVLRSDDGHSLDDLARAAAAVASARTSRFRRCVDCDTSTPPEWMVSDELCQSCAERHHGVVY